MKYRSCVPVLKRSLLAAGDGCAGLTRVAFDYVDKNIADLVDKCSTA